MDAAEPLTELLQRVERGDARASAELLPLLYDELRRLAGGYLRRNGEAGPTLQPTALVNEAWLRLERSGATARDRGHFCALAARAMRNVLVDHRRARGAAKRDPGGVRETLADLSAAVEEQGAPVLALHEALERLEALDPELGRLVELRFFAGLSIAATADALELSTATVERRWRVARAYLREWLPELR
ncbi:MAG: sigma-70 family RNA polymerase sigma factor [Planctomycetes bacterium]|nr:sigma-70 family RNA polymerase sigma factor [Planctomycetota bacterium]